MTTDDRDPRRITRPAVVCWRCRYTLDLVLTPEPPLARPVLDPAGEPCPDDAPTSPIEWADDGNAIQFLCPECDARQGYDLADL